MRIETKFDVRDRVWFMPMFGDAPVCGFVEIIEIIIGSNYCKEVYSVSHNNVCYELAPEDLFPTKEELLKSSMENQVSIIINGVRYDAVCVNEDLSHPSCCNVCDIGSLCIQGDTCLCYTFDIDNNFVFKKSDKKIE